MWDHEVEVNDAQGELCHILLQRHFTKVHRQIRVICLRIEKLIANLEIWVYRWGAHMGVLTVMVLRSSLCCGGFGFWSEGAWLAWRNVYVLPATLSLRQEGPVNAAMRLSGSTQYFFPFGEVPSLNRTSNDSGQHQKLIVSGWLYHCHNRCERQT